MRYQNPSNIDQSEIIEISILELKKLSKNAMNKEKLIVSNGDMKTRLLLFFYIIDAT